MRDDQKENDMFFRPHTNILEGVLNSIKPSMEYDDEKERTTLDDLDKTIENAISALEATLNIQALTDSELAEIYDTEPELHEDIAPLDFNT